MTDPTPPAPSEAEVRAAQQAIGELIELFDKDHPTFWEMADAALTAAYAIRDDALTTKLAAAEAERERLLTQEDRSLSDAERHIAAIEDQLAAAVAGWLKYLPIVQQAGLLVTKMTTDQPYDRTLAYVERLLIDLEPDEPGDEPYDPDYDAKLAAAEAALAAALKEAHEPWPGDSVYETMRRQRDAAESDLTAALADRDRLAEALREVVDSTFTGGVVQNIARRALATYRAKETEE